MIKTIRLRDETFLMCKTYYDEMIEKPFFFFGNIYLTNLLTSHQSVELFSNIQTLDEARGYSNTQTSFLLEPLYVFANMIRHLYCMTGWRLINVQEDESKFVNEANMY
jgi:hypothetical protein